MEEKIRKEIEELKNMIKREETKEKIQKQKDKLDKLLEKYLS